MTSHPAATSTSLVRNADPPPEFARRQRGFETRRARYRNNHRVGVRVSGKAFHRIGAIALHGDHPRIRPKRSLGLQRVRVAKRGQPDDLRPLAPEPSDDVERLRPDRARAAQNDDFSHYFFAISPPPSPGSFPSPPSSRRGRG